MAMKNALLVWLAVATAAMAGCVSGDDSDTQPLTATYRGDHGVGLDGDSASRLAGMLRPHEAVEAVDGERRAPLAEVDWERAARAGSLALEAVADGQRRPLGTLELAAPALPQSRAAPSGAKAVVPAAACSNNAHTYFCDNCQCSNDGTVLRGESQRYVCIYGSWYSENVYACNCQFTSHQCGTI